MFKSSTTGYFVLKLFDIDFFHWSNVNDNTRLYFKEISSYTDNFLYRIGRIHSIGHTASIIYDNELLMINL